MSTRTKTLFPSSSTSSIVNILGIEGSVRADAALIICVAKEDASRAAQDPGASARLTCWKSRLSLGARRFANARGRCHMLIYATRLGELVEFEARLTCSWGRPLQRLGILPCLERFHLQNRHRTFLEPERISRKLWERRSLITMQKGKKYSLLLLLSVGVAVSRVIVGLHFPSDVVGGGFLGIALAVASVAFLSRYVYPRLPPRFFMKGKQDMTLKSVAA